MAKTRARRVRATRNPAPGATGYGRVMYFRLDPRRDGGYNIVMMRHDAGSPGTVGVLRPVRAFAPAFAERFGEGRRGAAGSFASESHPQAEGSPFYARHVSGGRYEVTFQRAAKSLGPIAYITRNKGYQWPMATSFPPGAAPRHMGFLL